MNLKYLTVISLAVVVTVLTSCSTPIVPPEINSETSEEYNFEDYVESNQEGKMVFPKGQVGSGCIGDPMPYYENGVMNIFYLEDARNYTGPFHPISLLRTTDFMTYEEYDRVIPFENDRSANDWALGTGSVIKGKDGTYHFWYTGHNSNSGHGNPYNEKIQHAISTDLINWTKLNDGFYGDTNDFRDPHVVYMEDYDEYWMLITRYKNALGTLRKYVSKDLYNWEDAGDFYQNTVGGAYNMECPTLIRFKGYWYLSFSEQGYHRVTRYRYKKNLDDPWIVPEVDHFDDEGFYAGKITGDEDRLFLYGWCGTKRRSRDTGSLDWAGNLIGHELFQKENGELGVKPIKEIEEALATRYPHKSLTNKEIINSVIYKDTGFGSIAFEPFKSDRYARISFDYTQQSRSGSAGIALNVQGDSDAGTLVFELNAADQEIRFYNDVKSISNFGDVNYKIPFKFENNKKIHIDVYYDDQTTSVYVNGDVALTARTYALKDAPFALFAKDKRCTFENIEFYE